MDVSETIADGTLCTIEMYERDPEEYRGRIQCIECKKKAWHNRAYMLVKTNSERVACFGARHVEGCEASTVKHEFTDGLDGEEPEQSHDIYIDLDKAKIQSHLVSPPSNKKDRSQTNWGNSKSVIEIGGGSAFPASKSLRKILSYLDRNENFGDKGQTIKIVKDSGVTLIDGQLKDYLVKFEDINRNQTGEQKIFWGTINNVNIKDGTLWINYGDNRNTDEPSIKCEEIFKYDLMRNFNVSDVMDLGGSDVIIVGRLGYSPRGKPLIHATFTKYMSFRKRVQVGEGRDY